MKEVKDKDLSHHVILVSEVHGVVGWIQLQALWSRCFQEVSGMYDVCEVSVIVHLLKLCVCLVGS